MSVAGERAFEPPKPAGEPFRGDPSDAPPFLTENDRVPVVPVEAGVPFGAGPVFDHPPTHSTDAGRSQPVFQAPRPAQQLTPDERYAQIAFRLGIASIFIFNIILGPIAIFMGIASIRRGQKQHGKNAIILGAIGTGLGVTLLVLAALGVIPSVDEMLQDLRNRN